MAKEYEVIELIADVRRTEEGIQGEWNTAHALSVLNAKAKEGWEFKFLIPDEKGRCIVERETGEMSASEIKLTEKSHQIYLSEWEKVQPKKKAWQFWK